MTRSNSVRRRPILLAAALAAALAPVSCRASLPDADLAAVLARARTGDAKAEYEIGRRYQHGIGGLPKDLAQAADWYRRAADRGLAEAQCNLGVMLVGGLGAEKNESEGARLLRLAAENGIAAAQYALSVLYDEGVGVEKDPGQAFAWCRKAAEQGHAAAQFNLGIAYEKGIGTKTDLAEAMKWFRLATAQGDEKAAKALERLGR